MPPSINSYSLTGEPFVQSKYQTFNSIDIDKDSDSDSAISITLRRSDFEAPTINAKHFETLVKIEELEDNWDEEGSIAPPINVVQFARAILYLMSAIGQEIYNIAPGPKGEILILFNNDLKSFEVLIYPDKMRYVKFPENGVPLQDSFTPELLYTDLLSWLNA